MSADKAVAEVTATGARSEIGKIGQALSGHRDRAAAVARWRRGVWCAWCAIGGSRRQRCWRSLLYGLLRGSWLDALLAGIALGMSMLPEEFPLVLTVFMVMGAWRISRARVLTRRAAAIEALGAATVLCTDKTGTLTAEPDVDRRIADRRRRVLRRRCRAMHCPVAFAALLPAACSPARPSRFDPMERAFHDLAGNAGREARAGIDA